MAWTLYELAKNPHIQEKLRAEVQAAFPDDKDLTWEKLEELKYIGNVIKESLRLHSPVDDASRVAISDVDIRGFLVPAGTKVLFPIDATLRSSNHWSNPEMFNPDRFEENGGWLLGNLSTDVHGATGS